MSKIAEFLKNSLNMEGHKESHKMVTTTHKDGSISVVEEFRSIETHSENENPMSHDQPAEEERKTVDEQIDIVGNAIKSSGQLENDQLDGLKVGEIKHEDDGEISGYSKVTDQLESTGPQQLSPNVSEPNEDFQDAVTAPPGNVLLPVEEKEIIRDELDANDLEKHRRQSNAVIRDEEDYFEDATLVNRYPAHEIIQHDAVMHELERMLHVDGVKRTTPDDLAESESVRMNHQKQLGSAAEEDGGEMQGGADPETRFEIPMQFSLSKFNESAEQENFESQDQLTEEELGLSLKHDSGAPEVESGSRRSSRLTPSPNDDHRVVSPMKRSSFAESDVAERLVDADRRKSSAGVDVLDDHRESSIAAEGDETAPDVCEKIQVKSIETFDADLGASPEALVSTEENAENFQSIFEVFKLFDHDGDDCIRLSDFGTVLRCLKLNPTEADVRNLRSEFNGHDVKIGWSQFYPHIMKIMSSNDLKPASENELIMAFSTLDTENKGYLTISQLKNFLLNLGEPLDQNEFEQMLNTGAPETNEDRFDYVQYAKRIVGY